jgi:hypothetical protein
MAAFGDVFDSLAAMGQLQLLLAFVACIGYTVAQGKLVSAGGRGIAAVATAVAAVGFAFHSGTWAHGTVLIAVAVAGLGAFAAIVWLFGRLLGLVPARAAHPETLATSAPDGLAALGVAHTHPRRTQVPSA